MARLPRSKALLGVVESLSGSLCGIVSGAFFTRHNGGVVEHVDELTRLGGEEDLLLGALDDGGGVEVVCFLEFLAGDVCELCFGHEGLGFGADELLLERDELCGLWLLVLELLDLVLDLCAVMSALSQKKCVSAGVSTFCLCVRLGCTELSVLRICFKTVRLSSRPCAKRSSCSAISASSTPSLSLISLSASSSVLSPQSLSCPAMEAPSLEAFS